MEEDNQDFEVQVKSQVICVELKVEPDSESVYRDRVEVPPSSAETQEATFP